MVMKQAPAPQREHGKQRRAKPRLSYVVGSLDKILRRRMTDALAPCGLTLAQFTAMSVLEARGQASNAQLAERSFITPQSANEVMNVMATRGWITRVADPTHGRILLLQLTDSGRDVLRQCQQAVMEIEQKMLAGVPAEDVAAAQNCLEMFVRNLRE
ncbi:MAG: MarR family winged helix-turn-helix transcriptional regulator [Janthinobacterium lividum]